MEKVFYEIKQHVDISLAEPSSVISRALICQSWFENFSKPLSVLGSERIATVKTCL